MPTIKDIIELMGSSWPVALGILIASAGVLGADYLDLPYLASLPSWFPGSAFIAGLLSGSILIVGGIRLVVDQIAEPFAQKRRAQRRQEHIDGLADISQPEIMLLAWAVANQTQIFSGDYFNEHVKALLSRGYLQVPPGNHMTDKTPLKIPNYIWSALKADLKDDNLSELVGLRPFDRW